MKEIFKQPRTICWMLMLLGCYILVLTAAAKSLHPEKWYQDQWCADRGGDVEVVLEDRTRCDCLTDTHAIEFDFARKWAEAIGQALHYSRLTGRRAGIVLIIEKETDLKYVDRLRMIIVHYGLPIDLYNITTEDTEVTER